MSLLAALPRLMFLLARTCCASDTASPDIFPLPAHSGGTVGGGPVILAISVIAQSVAYWAKVRWTDQKRKPARININTGSSLFIAILIIVTLLEQKQEGIS